MNIRCLYCGKRVPRHGAKERDFNTATGEYGPWYPNPRHKKPNVSTSMSAIDPEGLFCTMRCAARYGVAAIEDEDY